MRSSCGPTTVSSTRTNRHPQRGAESRAIQTNTVINPTSDSKSEHSVDFALIAADSADVAVRMKQASPRGYACAAGRESDRLFHRE